jgi:hypothetical protein
VTSKPILPIEEDAPNTISTFEKIIVSVVVLGAFAALMGLVLYFMYLSAQGG